jgi:hypothetical protein
MVESPSRLSSAHRAERENIMVYTSLNGRIANFGRIYKEAEGDKKAFAVAFVNVDLGVKDPETGYYQSVPVKVVANGFAAEKLNQFEANEFICISNAQLSKDQDYTNAEGELVKGQLMFRVLEIANWPANYSANNSNTETKTAPAKKAAPAKTNAGAKPARPQRPARA